MRFNMRFKWFAIWFVANMFLLVVPPIIAFDVLDADLTRAHQLNPHLSTNADSATIPVFTLAILVFCTLLILNVVGLCGWWIWKRRFN